VVDRPLNKTLLVVKKVIASSWIAEYARLIINRILPGRFLRRVALLVGGTALAQALTLLVSPLVARLYSPEDVGILSIYLSLVSIMGGVACLRYETAIPLAEDDSVSENVVALSCITLVVTVVLFGIAVWCLSDNIARSLRVPAITPYLWQLPLGLLAVGAFQILSYWAIRKEAFSCLARARFDQSTGQAIVQLGMGAFWVGPLGLLLGDVMGKVSASLRLAWLLRRGGGLRFEEVSFLRIKQVATRYRRFPVYSTWAVLINGIGLYSLPLLMSG
jgi:O-antigen/teichoic acid export membrane protein